MKRFIVLVLTLALLLSPTVYAAQNPLVVPDGSGYNVRTGFNNALLSLVTLFAGPSAPNPLYPYQFWLNTTTNQVMQANSTATSSDVLGTLAGDGTIQWNLGLGTGTTLVTNGGTGLSTTLAYSVLSNNTASIGALASNQTLILGTPSYADTGILLQITGNSNSYQQALIQNINSGNTASTDFIVSNNLGTSSTYYGDFGINSSGFAGTSAFNAPNNTYLTATSGDLAIGTTSSNAIHFVINSGATDAMTISTAGITTLANPLPIASGGTNATTASAALTNLGAANVGANSTITSLSGLTTPLSVIQGGTGSSTAAGALNNLFPAAVQGNVAYYNGSNWVLLAPGTSGYYLQTQGAGANPQWVASATLPGGPVQGNVIYYNGSSWANLVPGTTGQFLQTKGASANPQWAAPVILTTRQTVYGGSIDTSGMSNFITVGSGLSVNIAATATNININAAGGNPVNDRIGLISSDTNIGSLVPSQTISSITYSTTTATVTTSANHNLVTGAEVTVSGATPTAYNGTYKIVVTGLTTFTYTMAANPGGNASPVGAYTVTNFLFGDIATTGIVTLGSTLLQPIYQMGGTPATTSGQMTFNTSQMIGYNGNGSTAPQSYRVFIGEAQASTATISSTLTYTLNGQFESPGTAYTVQAVNTIKHALGMTPRYTDIVLRNVNAEYGYVTGEEGYFLSRPAGTANYAPGGFKSRNYAGVTIDANIYMMGKSSTSEILPTTANWVLVLRANRGW